MTHTQLEHLKLIDAHLERLLAIAEKRTGGKWESSRIFGDWGFAHVDQITTRMHRPENDGLGITLNYGGVIQCVGPKDKRNEQSKADAAFIASCAGNAEAGWRATKAAIAEILSSHSARYDSWYLVCRVLNQDPGKLEDYPLPPWSESILAAFPLELIQKP